MSEFKFKPRQPIGVRQPPVKEAIPVVKTSMEVFVADLKKLNDFSNNKGTQYNRAQLDHILAEMRSTLLGIGPVNYEAINSTQKRTLGLLILAAKDCQDLTMKLSLVREASGTLRTNVIMCGGPDYKFYLKRIDSANAALTNALSDFGASEGESAANLWNTTHIVLDEIYYLASKGYMTIKPEGIKFTVRREEKNDNTTNNNGKQ